MHFGLNEDQTMLQDSVGRYLEGASELALVRGFVDGEPALAGDLQTGLMDLGVPLVLIPAEHGGLGMGVLEAALIQEALGRNVSPSPFTAAYGMAVVALRACKSDEWLGRIASGEVVMGVGATEAIGAREGAGLTLSGDKVSGRASFVMGAEAATHFLLTTGEQLLIVERGGAGIEEVALTTIDKTRHVVNLDLDGASAHLLAGNNHVEAQNKMIDAGRVLLAADTLGAASMMLEKAVAYSKEREQFNRPIGSFQAVKHMCAEMAAKLEPCRSLVWYAAYAQDNVPEEAALTSRLAKSHVSEVGKFVARTSTEVHGGMGFTDLLGLHYWFKRIGANRQLLGGPQAVRDEAAQLQGFVG
ncbi:MAG: acyl-CoA/acyl-ACP dehydrogenase [Rhodobiaceae bacterium]|jgi:alkylation response protein AidB-like acyl-CoA dehydrogenase|nr:acyl-CoA/acyl-ACP dehydrogenase [Rhodobiaceae bacterium]